MDFQYVAPAIGAGRRLGDLWYGEGLNRGNWHQLGRHSSGGAHFAAPASPETAGSQLSNRSSAALGTSKRFPMRMTGIEPLLAASYAVPLEIPRSRPASSTLTV